MLRTTPSKRKIAFPAYTASCAEMKALKWRLWSTVETVSRWALKLSSNSWELMLSKNGCTSNYWLEIPFPWAPSAETNYFHTAASSKMGLFLIRMKCLSFFQDILGPFVCLFLFVFMSHIPAQGIIWDAGNSGGPHARRMLYRSSCGTSFFFFCGSSILLLENSLSLSFVHCDQYVTYSFSV